MAKVASFVELPPPQPSSVQAEICVDEYDEEPQPPGSVHGELDEDDMQIIAPPFTILPTPHQPELTLKEGLVSRERQQRRIETERARPKRQFALNDSSSTIVAAKIGESNSLDEGLLGDASTSAHSDEESAGDETQRLRFSMERFLRNSDSFNPKLETILQVPQ